MSFSSPRTRRRLARLLALAALAGGVAALVVLLPDTGSAPRKEKLTSGGTAPEVVKARRLTTSDRKAINATLDGFVTHAVKRRAVQQSYELVTPALRAGISRKAWANGSIPVYPYPARGSSFHAWNVLYSNTDETAVQLLLRPKRGASVGPISFHVYLQKRRGAWLVDSFMPAATFAPE